jgi:hypothetical protein
MNGLLFPPGYEESAASEIQCFQLEREHESDPRERIRIQYAFVSILKSGMWYESTYHFVTSFYLDASRRVGRVADKTFAGSWIDERGFIY